MNNLISSPEWIEIETIIEKQLSDLMDIRNIDEKLTPDEMKIEIRARQLSVDKLLDFYNEYQFSIKKKEEVIVTFK